MAKSLRKGEAERLVCEKRPWPEGEMGAHPPQSNLLGQQDHRTRTMSFHYNHVTGQPTHGRHPDSVGTGQEVNKRSPEPTCPEGRAIPDSQGGVGDHQREHLSFRKDKDS